MMRKTSSINADKHKGVQNRTNLFIGVMILIGMVVYVFPAAGNATNAQEGGALNVSEPAQGQLVLAEAEGETEAQGETETTEDENPEQETPDAEEDGKNAEKTDDDRYPLAGTVTATTLNVRLEPNTRSAIVSRIPEGYEVTIHGEKDDWYQIRAPERSRAWVAKRYLTADGEVRADDVRVRLGGSVEFTSYATLNKGESVELKEQTREGWQAVVPPDNARVWVSADYIDVPEPEPAEEASEAVAAAEAQEVEEEETEGKVEEPPENAVARQPAVAKPAEESKEPESAEEEEESAETGPVEPQLFTPRTEELALLDQSRPPSGTVQEAERQGHVVPLGEARTDAASHMLATRIEGVSYPVCFLSTDLIELDKYSMQEVKISGEEHWYEGWKRPLIKVDAVELVR